MMAMSDRFYTPNDSNTGSLQELQEAAEDEFITRLNSYLKNYSEELKNWVSSAGYAEKQEWPKPGTTS